MADAPATNPIDLARQPSTESATRSYSRNYLNCPPYLGDGCLWPKADIRTESKWWFLNVRFGEIKRTFDVRISLNRYNTVFDFDLLAQYSMDIGSQKRRKL